MTGASNASASDYAPAWAKYKKIRRTTILVIASFIPATLFLSILLGGFGLSSRFVSLVAGLGFVAFMWVLVWRSWSVRCPRCGRRFGGVFARRCRNCDLPKWETAS